MSKRQLTPRQKLYRDLEEFAALLSLPRGSTERDEAMKRWVMRRHQLSERDLKRRDAAWRAMGEPALDSPEWLAELERQRKLRRGKQHVPPRNVDPDDFGSLFWRLMQLTALQAAGQPVDLIKTPGQNNYLQTKAERAEAARLYRYLWRNFPNLLRACDDDLRDLIRRAGGCA
jgi:hypothetical protein